MLAEWTPRLREAAVELGAALLVCLIIAATLLLQSVAVCLRALVRFFPVWLLAAFALGAWSLFDALRAILTAQDDVRGSLLAAALVLLLAVHAFAQVMDGRRWGVFSAFTFGVWLMAALAQRATVLLEAQALASAVALAPVLGVLMVGILLIQKRHERRI